MVVTGVEYPGFIHKLLCTIGRTIVFAGAVSKGKSEIREMGNIGVQKYFQASVSFSISRASYEANMFFSL
jgi:hypothetical protein